MTLLWMLAGYGKHKNRHSEQKLLCESICCLFTGYGYTTHCQKLYNACDTQLHGLSHTPSDYALCSHRVQKQGETTSDNDKNDEIGGKNGQAIRLHNVQFQKDRQSKRSSKNAWPKPENEKRPFY